MNTPNPILNVFDAINKDENITSQLGIWRGSPAITNIKPTPEDIEGRFISLEENSPDQIEYSGITMFKQTIDVNILSNNEQTTLELKTIALMIFELLHYKVFNTDTGVIYSKCFYPVYTSDDNYVGYKVSVEVSCTIEY